MTFTTVKPTVPGWYLWRATPLCSERPVCIFARTPGASYPLAYWFGEGSFGPLAMIDLQFNLQAPSEFAGPLVVPVASHDKKA